MSSDEGLSVEMTKYQAQSKEKGGVSSYNILLFVQLTDAGYYGSLKYTDIQKVTEQNNGRKKIP